MPMRRAIDALNASTALLAFGAGGEEMSDEHGSQGSVSMTMREIDRLKVKA
jgi:hypothetical protein